MHISKTVCEHLLRHPGARGFLWSSTIGDYNSIPGDLAEMLFYFIRRDADCLGQFLVGLAPRLGITTINKGKEFSPLQSLRHLINCDSGCFHFPSSSVWKDPPNVLFSIK